MNRIFDFQHGDPDEMTKRLVASVHRALDEHFPDLENQNSQFKKTQFRVDKDKTAIIKTKQDHNIQESSEKIQDTESKLNVTQNIQAPKLYKNKKLWFGAGLVFFIFCVLLIWNL